MNRTTALREQSIDEKPPIERVDSEQIFHPLAESGANEPQTILDKSEDSKSRSSNPAHHFDRCILYM